MSFRTKLLLVVLLTIFASVLVVTYGVTHYTSVAFEEMGRERTEALVAQFKKEFVQPGREIASKGRNMAKANFTEKGAIGFRRPNADLPTSFGDAHAVAQAQGRDFAQFVGSGGVWVPC